VEALRSGGAQHSLDLLTVLQNALVNQPIIATSL
jgi:hypothetical protein